MNTEEKQSSSDTGDKSTTMDTFINSVSVKLPVCWRDNIALWFAQAESQFMNSRVKDDFTKYNIIVAALDVDTLRCVSDVVIKPPAADKYTFLKTSLIERLQDSEEKRLTRLLTGLQLDDRKPSGLLRHMIELAGPALAESAIIRTLWLQRLPQHVQAILSSLPGDNLIQLASAADKILEVYQKTECGAVEKDHRKDSNSNQELNVCSVLQSLQEQISTLTHEVKQLKMTQNDGHGRAHNYYERRDYSPRREWKQPSSSFRNPARRPRSNSRGRTDNNNSTTGYCRYHDKFGEKSFKCYQPCSFNRNKSGNDKGNSQ